MIRRTLFVFTFCAFPLAARAQFPPPLESLKQVSKSLDETIRSATQDSNRPSMALIDRERAKSMSYDNQIKHTKTYFEKRKLNRQYRQAERLPRRTDQQIRASSKRAAPDRLTVQQYDAFRGRINWPVVLRDQKYAKQRSQLDQLFALHARSGGGIDTPQYASIQTVAAQMDRLLESNFKTTNSDQFHYAKRFLTSLKYEAKYPVGS